MKRKVPLPLNKWLLLSKVGAISALSYGLYAAMSEISSQDINFQLPLMAIPENPNQSEISDKEETSESVETTPSANVAPTPEKLTSSETALVSQTTAKTYAVDETGFKGVGKHSMAYKYKDYLVLSPSNDSVGEERAKVLKEVASKSWNKQLYSYWYGYGKEQDITPAKAHQFCKWALSYSEGTTFGSIGISKSYFDLLWKTCGQSDKSKPTGGGYR